MKKAGGSPALLAGAFRRFAEAAVELAEALEGSGDGGHDADELLKLSEAAGVLGLCYETVRSLAASGALPSVRVGRTRGIRVRRGDLDSYLKVRAGA